MIENTWYAAYRAIRESGFGIQRASGMNYSQAFDYLRDNNIGTWAATYVLVQARDIGPVDIWFNGSKATVSYSKETRFEVNQS